MEAGPSSVVVAVLRQLGQVDFPVVDLGHHVAGVVPTQAVTDESNQQDDDHCGGGYTGGQRYEGRGHELLYDGGGLLYHLHLHLVVLHVRHVFH